MIDFILDHIEIIVVVLLIIALCITANYQVKEKEKCEINGGIVIEHYMGYQCLTREDIEKLKENK